MKLANYPPPKAGDKYISTSSIHYRIVSIEPDINHISYTYYYPSSVNPSVVSSEGSIDRFLNMIERDILRREE